MELVAVVEVGGVVDRVNDNPRRTRGGSDRPTCSWNLKLVFPLILSNANWEEFMFSIC